ncbi:MAG TPA: hypothetical protein VMZ91_14195 [Candidatus Paceibacterota bacterium]|nr:hypothetical protein [Candidatus Paceibacterota bacterium]
MVSKESKNFLEEKELIKLQTQLEKYKHEIVMKELEFRRESDVLHHEKELERNRLKSAEIKRTIMLKGQERRY